MADTSLRQITVEFYLHCRDGNTRGWHRIMRVRFTCKRARGILHWTTIKRTLFLLPRKFKGDQTGNRTRAVKLRHMDESLTYESFSTHSKVRYGQKVWIHREEGVTLT